MATMYHPSTHADGFSSKYWDQSVPLADENTPFENPNMFETDPYSFPMTTYSSEAAQPDSDTLRDSSRSLKTQRSGNMNTRTNDDRSARDTRTSQSRSRGVPTANSRSTTPGRKPSPGAGTSTEDLEKSAWIHRDKLAQIESREMAQAGIRVRQSSRHPESTSESRAANRSASRSASRADHRRAQSRDRPTAPTQQQDEMSAIPISQARNQYQVSTNNQAEGDSPTNDDDLDYDPAMLQDIPSDKGTHGHSRSITRPATSRIPIARASPAPLSNAVVERDAPLPRSRTASNNFAPPDNKAYQKHRARSQSLGSSVAMDEVIGSRTSTSSKSRPRSSHIQSPRNSLLVKDSPRNSVVGKDSPQSSPPKARSTGRQPASSLNNRKGNTPKQAPRSRTTSAARKTSPTTRTRPLSASKRPEGDAPWIATMYKPDPRIPQDQQILPTHAKRMMQGQTDKDGNTVDRDFNTLDDSDLARMGAFPTPSPPTEVQETGGTTPTPTSPRKEAQEHEPPWPLSPIHSETRHSSASPRPGTSGGGYKITPTIALPSQSPPGTRSSAKQPDPRKQNVQRVPDVDEKQSGKKEKSCGCCIMM